MRTSFKSVLSGLVLLAIGGGMGVALSRQGSSPSPTHSANGSPPIALPLPAPSTRATENTPRGNSAGAADVRSNFIAEAVERVGPAVVRIDAARTISTGLPDALQNPFFRRFFSEDANPNPERVERGTGSGFVLSADGRIVTNAHVVEGADEVEVTLKDGRTFQGKVLGVDKLTDVAVVQIEASQLPTAPLGSAENLIPGQWAIAIGNPLGLDNTVTVGIVSAIGRSSAQVGISDKRVRFIQTDAAINPGNSGGPLLNDRGEVIGINTAIRANAQGLGFAIPIETALSIATQISNKGHAEHPFLGIQMVDLTPELKAEFNRDERRPFDITRDSGVLVVQVLENSPAAQGGLQPGDIIVKIEGQTIVTASDVQEQVELSSVGSVLTVEVVRNSQPVTLQVTTGTYPESESQP